MNNISVKICGLCDKESVTAAVNAGAKFIGFVHHLQSSRHISLDKIGELKDLLPYDVKSVMVVVNPSDALLTEIDKKIQPDYIQLHGEETAARVREIRNHFPQTGLIKALAVQDAYSVKKSHEFEPFVDYLLFDAKDAGSGKTFDWAALSGNTPNIKWFLSGGLRAENITQAIKQTGAKFVDVSSGVERSKGVKDVTMISEFIRLATS